MTLRILFESKPGQVKAAFGSAYYDLEVAGQSAIEEAGADALVAGRLSIASAGFNSRWQKALRLKVYPPEGGGKPPSLRARASIYHKIPYADVFESGATIRGKPLMWRPLPSVERLSSGTRKPLSPAQFINTFGLRLAPAKSKRGTPLLVAPVAVPKGTKPSTFNLSDFRAGARAKRADLKAARLTKFSVPVFVGLDVVTMRKKFRVTEAVEAASSRLPALFVKYLKV